MDIIYAIALAIVFALTGVVITTYSTPHGKPSLGPAYEGAGSAVKYWALIAANVMIHTVIFYVSPLWFSALVCTLALAGFGFNLYWASQVRKSQKRVAEIFAEAKADAARKAQLEQIAEKRAKLAEARSALEAGMPERATRLANEAR